MCTKDKDGNQKPSMTLVHGVLILVQIIFGIGSVLGKLGVAASNPVLFALIREGTAGPIILIIAVIIEGWRVRTVKDWWLFLLGGICIFVNQFGFIVGEKLASAVIGSAWQPSQPIFVVMIAMIIGWEKPTVFKILGILLAFAGAAFMVFFGKDFSNLKNGFSIVVGNVLFFMNCLGTALYVIFTRPLLKKYPPLTVTGFCYICASVFMAITALSINATPTGLRFVCPPNRDNGGVAALNNSNFVCTGDANEGGNYTYSDTELCSCEAWTIPASTILPLLYWIIFNSVVAYLLMTWGNKFAQASKVLAYTALQPLTSAILAAIIIAIVGKDNPNYKLKLPGWNALGGIGIILGLACIIYDNISIENRLKKEAANTLADPLLDDSTGNTYSDLDDKHKQYE